MKHDKDGEFPRKFQRNSHAIAMQNPEFDQHNEEILSEIGYSKDAIVEPKEEDMRFLADRGISEQPLWRSYRD
jgi:hypothetical protein